MTHREEVESQSAAAAEIAFDLFEIFRQRCGSFNAETAWAAADILIEKLADLQRHVDEDKVRAVEL